MPDDFEEEIEKYERIERVATFVGTIISVLLNIWVAISILTDLLGVDLGRCIQEIQKWGWRLPPNWVQAYQPYLMTMQWVLLFTVIVDTAVSLKYSVEGEPRVPLPYLRVVSFIGFFCGLWLYLAYHIAVYGIIFLASFVTLMYSLFVRKEETTEEEEEDFEPEIWVEPSEAV